MVEKKAQSAGTIACMNATLIGEGNPQTVMHGVVNETASAFNKAVIQLNSSLLDLLGGGCVESAFESVQQESLMTIIPGGVAPKVKVIWTDTS